jgi:preprotein translocase SecE subunit
VARDRQRAKQRKQRQAPQQPSRDRDRDAAARDDAAPRDDAAAGAEPGPVLPEPDALHRENVPGPWEHGGEVDEFEAAIVAGADGEPEDDPNAAARAALGEGGDDDGGDDLPPTDDDTPEPAGVPAPRHSEHAPASGRGGGRFLNFLRASWAELQRVQWPDRRQVGQATAVVLGFVIVAGAFLGFADFVANEIVDLIL